MWLSVLLHLKLRHGFYLRNLDMSLLVDLRWLWKKSLYEFATSRYLVQCYGIHCFNVTLQKFQRTILARLHRVVRAPCAAPEERNIVVNVSRD